MTFLFDIVFTSKSLCISAFPLLTLSLQYITFSLYVCLSVCFTVCLPVSLFLSFSVCLSVSQSVSQSVWQSVCLPFSLSVCLSLCLSVCLSVCLSLFHYVLHICLSLFPIPPFLYLATLKEAVGKKNYFQNAINLKTWKYSTLTFFLGGVGVGVGGRS
jgi:hypothetical protein